MATANRYTQLQNTTYQPRSLQELMMVPAYKRKQHDDLNAGIAEYETKLAAAKGLDAHQGALSEEQEKLYNKMSSQRDKLEGEGFSQTSKSDFIRFNKEYQQSVGASGTIGKITAAQEAYDKRSAQILDYSIKAGNDPGETQARLNEQYQDYSDKFKEDGKIENFQGELPPAYKDLYKDIANTKDKLGHTIKTDNGEETYEIIPDSLTGGFVFKTSSGKTITKDNAGALGSALASLENDYLNPQGAGYRSLMQWNRGDEAQTKEAIRTGLNTMRIREEKDTTKTNFNLTIPPKAKPGKPPAPDADLKVSAYDSNSKVNGLVSQESVAEQMALATDAGDTAKANRIAARFSSVKHNYDYLPGADNEMTPIAQARYDEQKRFKSTIWEDVPEEVQGTIGQNRQAQIYEKADDATLAAAMKEGDFTTYSHKGVVFPDPEEQKGFAISKAQKNGASNEELAAMEEEPTPEFLRVYGTVDGEQVLLAPKVTPAQFKALQYRQEVERAYNKGLDQKLLHDAHQNTGVTFTNQSATDTKKIKPYNNK